MGGGQALKKHPRESLIVQTKVRPFKDPAEFRATLETSLKNIDTHVRGLLSDVCLGADLPYLLQWRHDLTSVRACVARSTSLASMGSIDRITSTGS
jgi:hypothetical protein